MTNFHRRQKMVGEMMVEQWVIDQQTLDLALAKQITLAKQWFQIRVGEILVGWKILDRKTVINFLGKSQIPLRILEVLFLRADINEEQYKTVQKMIIENQKKGIHKSVWDIIIELGYIQETDFYNILSSSGIPLNIEERLLQKWVLTRQALTLALEDQKNNSRYKDAKILDVLVSEWFITQEVYKQFKPLEIETIEFKF